MPTGTCTPSGRSEEMIKTGGFSVDPQEVERVLLGVAGVRAAAVVGVPDPHWGEMVVAYVEVAQPGSFDEPAAIDACGGQIAGFELHERALVPEALPVKGAGKVARGELRRRWAGETAPAP